MRFRSLITVLVFLGALAAAGFYVLTIPTPLPARALPPRTADLANGETMFNVGGCASCHARPQQENRLALGGGLALRTPFGTFRAPNISPDPKAGIGSWGELQFANALLKGVGAHEEHLYPAFPYTSFQRMTLEDVRDLYAFMMRLPADPTPSQRHELAFPFTFRRGIGLWKVLFVDGQPFRPDPARDAVYNRGAYLIEGPGHCAECHSPRNVLGAIEPGKRFAGGANLEGGGWAPNITPHADGLADWSLEDVASFLQSGVTPVFYSVASPMADVIANTAKLSTADRQAMATYLKALPPRPGKKPADKQAGRHSCSGVDSIACSLALSYDKLATRGEP
jgi:mono/diheme cytochrome c family protein